MTAMTKREPREPQDPQKIRAAIEEYFRGLLGVLGEPRAQIEWLGEGRRSFRLNLQGVEALRQADLAAIDALAYLAEIAVLRRTGAAVRITLDVNRQRERHLQELRQMARRWAEEVLLEGQPMELEPMGAQERKAIHEALSGVAGVRTYSKGRGKGRRVVIEPVAPSAVPPSAPGEDELPVRPTEVRPDDDQRDE